MVKWLVIFLIVFFIGNISSAQNKLIIEGTAPKLYLIHKVVTGENFYSVGRLYNVSAKGIATFNNLQFANGLNIGESIKIPLTAGNFVQSGEAADGQALIPVYHSVVPGEGLYRIGINYNKVPLTTIKKWNHLQSDDVVIGTPLIVGYLKVNKNESKLITNSVNANTEVTTDKQPETKPIPPAPVIEDKMPPVKKPDVETAEQKDVHTAPTEEHKATVTAVTPKSNTNFPGGYFKKLYDDQTEKNSPVTAAGTAGTFKSTSGWQDGKYYCFNNDAPPGAVIKVINYATGKSIYAKVLDAIPDIKQNEGLAIIVSNAAAEELNSGDKFNCTLSYVK
ncbi:MAG: LysM peptidoglycan-binding domain-containing protein [Ginsengibacter sp.]